MATLDGRFVPLAVNEAVTPGGRFKVFKITTPLKPDSDEMLIVSVACEPGETLNEASVLAMEKSPVPLISKVAVTEWLMVPEVPVMVTE